MAQTLHFKKISNELLAPASPEAEEFLRTLKTGAWFSAPFSRTRNYRFHQKFMSLIQFGFGYYTPTGGTLTPEEKELVTRFGEFICRIAGALDGKIMEEVADLFLESEGQRRAKGTAIVMDFNHFRKWATIEAGYYIEYQTPSGNRVKEAKSISFARMDDLEFQGVFKSVFNVLWNWILFRQFSSEQEAQNTMNNMLGFTS